MSTLKQDETRTAAVGTDDLPDFGSDAKHLLLVMADDQFATYPLVREMVIGRSSSADIQIDSPSVSRRHLRIGAGPPFVIEDLGSANGTVLHGARLPANNPTELDEGETLKIGDVIVRIQRRDASSFNRQLQAHGTFMQTLRAQCALADKGRQQLALLRVSCPTPAAATLVQQKLGSLFRLGDAIGQYAPQEFEVIVVARSRDDLSPPLARADKAVTASGCSIGVAHYGGDGTAPDALLARAGARSQPSRVEVTEPGAELLEPALGPVVDLIRTVGPGDISVLILGETGVGKEVVAELIHRYSRRADAPLVKINCAAISASLLESELFGHERGAFTGADRVKPGLIESADGGTFFLDEVAEMPIRLQAKLLQVLEAHSVRRVGGVKSLPINVRFLAAANRDLRVEIEAKRFRADLFYRLSGVAVNVPPLRERAEHVASLAELFLGRAAQRAGRAEVPSLSAEALDAMRTYPWPGNVRELKNVIERAALICDGDEIRLAHLSFQEPGEAEVVLDTLVGNAAVGAPPPAEPEASLAGVDELAAGMAGELASVERAFIVEALRRTGGNQTKAARLLAKSRNWMVIKLREHAVSAADWS